MADIFISCDKNDHGKARRLVDSLRAVGYKVSIEDGSSKSRFPSFQNVAGRIASAKVVLTIWTERSVASARVIDESTQALKTGKYIGALLDKHIRLPQEFSNLRVADMTGSTEESEEFDWLCDQIDAVISSPDAIVEPAKVAPKNASLDAESAIWYKVSNSDNAPGYEFYLNQYGGRGTFGAQAKERLRALTTWSYRLNRFTNAGWVKALAAVTIVCGGAALFAMSYSKSNMVSHDQYAALQAETDQLGEKLSAANTSRLNLIASFRDKVSRSEYVALSNHARKLEEQLDRSASAAPESTLSPFDNAATAQERGAAAFAELDQSLDSLFGASGALDNTVDTGGFGGIEPASGSPWSCTLEGEEGINFGSTCWSRTANTLALQGFGIETATSLEPVELMRGLETLEVAGARLNDLDPLSTMKTLREINISGTAVEDIGPLASLTELEFLDLRGTSVSDLTPLKNMTKLKSFCAPNGPCTIDDIEQVQSFLDETVR